MKNQLCIIGTGYVGLVSGVCFADAGNQVVCVDIDKNKIKQLKKGISPIYEPQLEDLLKKQIQAKRISFTSDLKQSALDSDIIFMCLPTPSGIDGSVDTSYIENCVNDLVQIFEESPQTYQKIIVSKSTVPIGTCDLIERKFEKLNKECGRFFVVSNPEFLKEGDAINDFLKPDRVVIGTEHDFAFEKIKKLYRSFMRKSDRIIRMSRRSAELTKYAANTMLAMRITYMNELSRLCDLTGANINEIRQGVGADDRIGKSFLYAGVGYGGSCFPKDVKGLDLFSRKIFREKKFIGHTPIINAITASNEQQKDWFGQKLMRWALANHSGTRRPLRIAIWGLAFKPETDDVREAPSFDIVRDVFSMNGEIVANDPAAMENFKRELKHAGKINFVTDPYAALIKADALILLTEWRNYRDPDWTKIRRLMKPNPTIFDGRNIWNRNELEALGFAYCGVGI